MICNAGCSLCFFKQKTAYKMHMSDWSSDVCSSDLLGYRFRSLEWRCPLARDGQGGWRCDGELHATGGKPFRLSVALASGSTDAELSRGDARFALHRSAATPDDTMLDLTRVPVAWAQALSSQAWSDGRLTARSEEHTSAHPSLMRSSYAGFC